MPVVRRPSSSQRRFLGGNNNNCSTRPLPNLHSWLLKSLMPVTPPQLSHLPRELGQIVYSYLGERELALLAGTCRRFYRECSPLQVQVRWNTCVEKAAYTERHTDFGGEEEEQGWWPDLPPQRAFNYPILYTSALAKGDPFFVRLSNRSTGVVYFQGYGGRAHRIYDGQGWNWVGRAINLAVRPQQDPPRALDSAFWEAAKSENVVVTVLAEPESGQPRLVHCSLLYAYWWRDNDERRQDNDDESGRWTLKTLHQNVWPNQARNERVIKGQLDVVNVVTQEQDPDDETTTQVMTVTLDEMRVVLHNPSDEDDDVGWESSGDDSWQFQSNPPPSPPISGAEDDCSDDYSDEVNPRQERRREKAGTHKHKHRRRPPRRVKEFVSQRRKKDS